MRPSGRFPAPSYVWIFDQSLPLNLVGAKIRAKQAAGNPFEPKSIGPGKKGIRRGTSAARFTELALDTGGALPTSAITIAIGQTKIDTTNRTQLAFSFNTEPNTNQRIQLSAPWSDGNMYWDFGGISGGNRLTVTTPPTSGYRQWVVYNDLSVGRRAAYENGTLRGSGTGTGTARTEYGNLFGLRDADETLTHYIFIWPYALTDSQAAWLSRYPYSWFAQQNDRSFYPVPTAAGGFRAAWAAGSNGYLGGSLHAA